MSYKDKEKKLRRAKEYYVKHKGEIRKKQKEHYEKHKEQRREYRETHPEYREQNKERSKKWYEKNKEKCRENRRAKKIEFPWLSHYYGAKQRCNNPRCDDYKYYGGKGIQMLLTEEHVMILWLRDNAMNLDNPSIDRIDNSGDYDFGNCQFIEVAENSRRRNVQKRQNRDKYGRFLFQQESGN